MAYYKLKLNVFLPRMFYCVCRYCSESTSDTLTAAAKWVAKGKNDERQWVYNMGLIQEESIF